MEKQHIKEDITDKKLVKAIEKSIEHHRENLNMASIECYDAIEIGGGACPLCDWSRERSFAENRTVNLCTPCPLNCSTGSEWGSVDKELQLIYCEKDHNEGKDLRHALVMLINRLKYERRKAIHGR